MDAAADYAAAGKALAHRFPAYVSYVVRSHVAVGRLVKDETAALVVRTSDGTIVKGTPPSMQVGSDATYAGDVVRHPPFDPACYAATGARDAAFEGRTVEALTLANICKKQEKSDGDFTTLFVDPSTHEPLAATGHNRDDTVAVEVAEHFARAGTYLLPAAFDVRVAGSGVMSWLDVTGRQTYDGFAFHDAMP